MQSSISSRVDLSTSRDPKWLCEVKEDKVDLETGYNSDHDRLPPQTPPAAHKPDQRVVVVDSNVLTLPPDNRGASRASLNSTLVEEKANSILPPQKYKHAVWLRNLRWRFVSVYYRLNIFVIAANIIPMIILGAQGMLLSLSPQLMSTAVAANITAAVLIRQELFVNLLFLIFGCCPRWMPLFVRRLSAKIYHLGGVHSGAGIAALVWFALFNVTLVRSTRQTPIQGVGQATLVITAILDVLLLSLVGFSHPNMRKAWHNTWECIHRYAGWTAVILFWANYGMLANASRESFHPDWSIFEMLIRDPAFWMLFTITMAILLPWLRLRRVAVHAEPLSSHAVRLHFTYTNLPLCAAPRLSDSPFREWHSFAGIPEPDGHGFSVIVSKAGDWTTQLIRQPPSHLWVRGMPVRGVLHVAPIFKSMVLVATGSGIGPILSLLTARQIKCRILWSTRDPEKTYKKGIMADVLLADPHAVILNTTGSQRPNMIHETYKLYKESGAEAVFIISNPKVCSETVYELESRGIPAFAPVFDS